MLDGKIKADLLRSSLFGTLFTAAKFDDYCKIACKTAGLSVASFNPGDELVKFGGQSNKVILLLSGEAELQTPDGASGFSFLGKLAPFRIADLNSVLIRAPYGYRVRAKTSGTYLTFDRESFLAQVEGTPHIRQYLINMTSSIDFRRLSKTIEDAGCGKDFRIGFLATAALKTWGRAEWVLEQGQSPAFAFFPVQGTLVSVNEGSSSTTDPNYEPPLRVWYYWPTNDGAPASAPALRTVDQTTALVFSYENAKKLRHDFPEDWQIFSQFVSSGRGLGEEQDEVEEPADADLSELFTKSELTAKKKSFGLPIVMQNSEMDCGPACLAMISTYFGVDASIQFWRNLLSTSREGTSMFDLAVTAERVGFVTHGILAEDLQELDRNLFPLIALRHYHFMVVYEVTSKDVLVGDPGLGLRRIPIKEFTEKFEGFCLLIKPTPQAADARSPKSQYAHFVRLFSGFGQEYSAIALASILIVVVSSFFPILSQILIDEVIESQDQTYLLGIIAIAILLSGVHAAVSWIRSYYISYLSTRIDFNAQSGLMRKILSVPFSYVASRTIGDFTRRISEFNEVRFFFTRELISTVLDLFTASIFLAVVFFYQPLVASILAVSAPLLILLSLYFGRKLQRLYNDYFEAFAENDSLTTDLIKGMLSIKASGAETGMRWRFENSKLKALKGRLGFELTHAKLSNIAEFFEKTVRYGCIGTAALVASQNGMSSGQIVAISIFAERILSPFLSASRSWTEFVRIRVVLDRLNDVLLTTSETSKGSLTLKKLRGEIEFRDVWFRYGGEASDWVLKEISFKIKPGDHVALVGASGSGKSTLGLLLMRFYEPQKGQIFIDGRDYREYDLTWLRRQLGYIGQEIHLFSGSIGENIALGEGQPQLPQIFSAIQKANAVSMIRKKPGGLQYRIPHGGLGFSGGEKQKIALSRMYYFDPSIMVVDEATAHLDPTSEREVLNNLNAASSERTVLQIAHRLAPIRHSKLVFVFQEGRIVEQGSVEKLLRTGKVFKGLFGDQFAEDRPNTDSKPEAA